MNKWKYCLICLLGALQLTAFAAPKEKKEKVEEPKRVYMFGVSTDFNDSIIYVTDVQHLDSVFINPDGSIQDYTSYSLQLKVYLEGALGESNQTCAVIYSDKKKQLEKRYIKARKRYRADKGRMVIPIGTNLFQFHKR